MLARHVCWLLLIAAVLAPGWPVNGEPPAAKPAAGRTDAAERTDQLGYPLPKGALARLGTLRFRDGNYIRAVAVAPDGKTLALGGNEGIRILELPTGKELRVLKTTPGFGFDYLVYAPDGKTFGAEDQLGRIVCWNPATGEAVGRITPATPPKGRPDRGFSFSGDGKYVATSSADFAAAQNYAYICEVATGKPVTRVEALHNHGIRAVLSADGQVLATSGRYTSRGLAKISAKENEIPQTIQLWDAATGKELCKVRTEGSEGVRNVTFSPDSKQMVAAIGNVGMVTWDVATGKELHRFTGRSNIGACLAFSPDGKTLAASTFDDAVQTWDAATGKRRGVYDVPRDPLPRIGFTTDGRLLAWGSIGQSVYVRDVLAEKPLTPTAGHQAGLTDVGFTADGKVVSASWDGVVCFWSAAGQETRRVQLRTGGSVVRLRDGEAMPFPRDFLHSGGVRLSPDGKHVLGTRPDGTSLFELAKGREVCTLPSHFGAGLVVAAFSSDGNLLAAASNDLQTGVPALRLYDVNTGRELRKVDEVLRGDPRAVAFAPDGKMVVSASNLYQAGRAYRLGAWETATGKEQWRVERPQGPVQAVRCSSDGTTLAVLDPGGGISLYEAASGAELRRLGVQVDNPIATTFGFSPDGRVLAVAVLDSAAHKSHVFLYEVASGTVRQEFTGHDGQVSALAFAPDGKRLATAGNDTTVLLWDLTGNSGDDLPKAKPTADELDKFWEALNDADSRAAFKAMRRLKTAPAEAVALLAKHVKPVEAKTAPADTITKLIAALDADSFDEREKAARDLAALGKAAEAPLKKALAGKPSAEVRQAIENLLDKLKDNGGPPLELVRPLRAIEVLEDLGTPAARKLLETLTKGQAEAPLTLAAKDALGRLNRAAVP